MVRDPANSFFYCNLERGTGFEPATICLEGRDSTTELPPLIRLLNSLVSAQDLGTWSLGPGLNR
jgi:hypothetical protein